MSAETIHEAFELDLNEAKTHEEVFKILDARYSALIELVQPEAQDKDRMKKIRLITPKIGNALIVYRFSVQSKINGVLNQIAKLEQRRSTFQRVKEWFRIFY